MELLTEEHFSRIAHALPRQRGWRSHIAAQCDFLRGQQRLQMALAAATLRPLAYGPKSILKCNSPPLDWTSPFDFFENFKSKFTTLHLVTTRSKKPSSK